MWLSKYHFSLLCLCLSAHLKILASYLKKSVHSLLLKTNFNYIYGQNTIYNLDLNSSKTYTELDFTGCTGCSLSGI